MAKFEDAGDGSVERGMELLGKGEEELIGYLGYLCHEEEGYRSWQQKEGVVLPSWDEEEKWFEYSGGVERGAVSDWLPGGAAFLQKKVVPYLQKTICENGECRKEIKDLEDDVKGLLKYLIGVICGFISVSVPAAAVSISVVIAVLLIKKGLRDLCRG